MCFYIIHFLLNKIEYKCTYLYLYIYIQVPEKVGPNKERGQEKFRTLTNRVSI